MSCGDCPPTRCLRLSTAAIYDKAHARACWSLQNLQKFLWRWGRLNFFALSLLSYIANACSAQDFCTLARKLRERRVDMSSPQHSCIIPVSGLPLNIAAVLLRRCNAHRHGLDEIRTPKIQEGAFVLTGSSAWIATFSIANPRDRIAACIGVRPPRLHIAQWSAWLGAEYTGTWRSGTASGRVYCIGIQIDHIPCRIRLAQPFLLWHTLLAGGDDFGLPVARQRRRKAGGRGWPIAISGTGILALENATCKVLVLGVQIHSPDHALSQAVLLYKCNLCNNARVIEADPPNRFPLLHQSRGRGRHDP